MLSDMVGDFFTGNILVVLPTFGMLLFMVVFLAVSWTTFRKPKQMFDHLSRLPLEDEIQPGTPARDRSRGELS